MAVISRSGNGMAVHGVQRKAHVLIHPVALRPVPVLPADHGTLQNIGLLFRPKLRRKRAAPVLEIPQFVPLVLRKCDHSLPVISGIGPERPTLAVRIHMAPDS